MRKLEEQQGCCHCEETRNSSRVTTNCIKGTMQQFTSNGRGKIQNHDYEPIHYSNL